MAGAADTAKTCVPCTFCCKVMAIDELAKPVGRWCDHCQPGKGCKVYGQHPQSCRDFACQWLLEPGMPHKYRLDQTKVVLTADGAGSDQRLVANCDPANPVAWRREPIYSLLKQQARVTWGSGMTVVAKAGDRMWLIAPEEDVDMGLVDQRSPFQIEQGPDRRVRVTVLPPIPKDEDVGEALAELRACRLGPPSRPRSGAS